MQTGTNMKLFLFGYKSRYKAEVLQRLSQGKEAPILTEEDMAHLPEPVEKYLYYVGAPGKPKIQNFRARFSGSMKLKMQGDWIPILADQYNFYDEPARIFYIRSSKFGIPIEGLHRYTGNSATMQIKVASLLRVVNARGEKMTHGETVTMFNDMCMIAPPTLINKKIQWKTIDPLMIQATFTNQGTAITATLSFNEDGALVNFISNDRYYSEDGKTYISYPWSTPVKEYRDVDGRKVPVSAQAVWHTPQGEYVYAKFDVQEIEYNCRTFIGPNLR